MGIHLGRKARMEKKKKWTLEEVETHIKTNMDYGSAIVIAALFKKLYGHFPKIGLSGFQGEAANVVINKLPGREN